MAEAQPKGVGPSAAAASTLANNAAVEQVNQQLQQSGSNLQFHVDKDTGRTVYKVVDQHTGKVVLQVPSEEVLAVARNLQAIAKQHGASGVLVDKEG